MTADRRALRAITFDLGDTLWHFPDPPPAAAITRHLVTRIERLLDGWGVHAGVAPDDLLAQLRSARVAADTAADEAGGGGPDYIDVVRRVTSEAGLPLSETQIHELWQAQNVGGAFLGRRVFDDTIPTLQWLRARGVRIAALTNRTHGGATFLEELRVAELLPYFDLVVSSDQVGYRKPHPAIFERVLDAWKLPPGECAHVGDRLEVDIAGARRAGMVAIWMRALAPPDQGPTDADEEPNYTIEHIGALTSLGVFGGAAAS